MEIVLTIMCMVYKNDGTILVQDRKKKTWPGINFPGGHVEPDESITNACIREMKEETGLNISNLEQCGYFEWDDYKENKRHLAILFRTSSFSGELCSSNEGEMYFLTPKEALEKPYSIDFDKILEICLKNIKNFN